VKANRFEYTVKDKYKTTRLKNNARKILIAGRYPCLGRRFKHFVYWRYLSVFGSDVVIRWSVFYIPVPCNSLLTAGLHNLRN